MEQKHQEQTQATDKVLAFDTIFTSNHIKMLKILLFFLDSPMQKWLAIYIKFMELQYTLSYFNTHSSIGIGKLDFNEMYKEILPYCGQEERKKFEQFAQMQQMMENFKHISETMEMMKEFMPDMGDMFSGNPFGDSPFENDSPQNQTNMMSLLMNMLSPEQKEMFTMFGGMNNHDNAVDEG